MTGVKGVVGIKGVVEVKGGGDRIKWSKGGGDQGSGGVRGW